MINATVVFIDSSVTDRETLQTGVVEGVETSILNPNHNGIEQITAVLQQHPQVNTIHIVAHGTPGCLYLGNSQLNLENLQTYKLLIANWNVKNILLYSCNLAAGDAGEEFIRQLYQITNATISASTTKTGNAVLGGNWELEITLGKFTPNPVFTAAAMAHYAGVLAAPVLVNKSFTVNEGSSIIVTNSMLRTTDADNTDAQLIYTLKSLPTNGTLRLNGVNLALNSKFTQDDINNNRLSYIHNGSETIGDSFNFV
ncbi:MAG: DUF4347 domain-containing protein, partial [Sphaerospermopsis kisseleviana]